MNVINLPEFRAELAKKPEIKLAYLIGSAARGSLRADSDLDIVLVVDSDYLEKVDFGSLYLTLSRTVNHPNLDLRMAALKKTDPLFLFNVIGGELLYSRDEKERVNFEAKTMIYYYDTQHLRNIFHHYLNQRLEKGEYGL
jgi:predicted nucleotidyltransferase